MSVLAKNTILDGRLSSKFPKDNIILLDAGLGTTLEDVLHKDISHPLWSAHLIDSEPEAILEAHLAFLKAGSSIILTATYQCAPETFARAGYTPEKASDIMHKAVQLAVQAREQHLQPLPTNDKSPKIALSLGPYGATLTPATEFSGIYPPPYGPAQPGTCFNAVLSNSAQKEQEAEDALVKFHLNRLRIFASSSETWSAIDMIAFETVPLLREARAIRRAMNLLASTNPLIQVPPWWISFNFADGVLAEQDPIGNRYTAADATRVCFEQTDQLSVSTPFAFGINCTQIKYVSACVQLASQTLAELAGTYTKIDQSLLSQLGFQGANYGPVLVLYPNGGPVYVPSTMTWLPPSPAIPELNGFSDAQIWAKKLVAAVVEGAPQEAVWSGLIIGGCCKTDPDYLSALKDLF